MTALENAKEITMKTDMMNVAQNLLLINNKCKSARHVLYLFLFDLSIIWLWFFPLQIKYLNSVLLLNDKISIQCQESWA